MVSVRETIEAVDLEAFGKALAEDVVWIGLWPGELCRNRGEVLDMLEDAEANGVRPEPEVVHDGGDVLVVDPHLDGRHQVLSLRDGLVTEVRAYPSREAALKAVEDRPW
jgi:ketosteroid isomerase-like protein